MRNRKIMEKLSLSAQIILWIMGCSTAIWVVVFLCMSYYHLPSFSLAIVVPSLVILLMVCTVIVARHLRPLDKLARQVQRVTEGHLDEQMPAATSSVSDEIGQLEDSFRTMQHSLSDYIADLQQKREQLSRQNTQLQEAYEKAREADGVRERFLSNMTDQMASTVDSITRMTHTICTGYGQLSRADMVKIQIQILTDTDNVTRMLDQMLSASQQGQQQQPQLTESIML